jgi:hypothetical protein
MDEIDGPKFRDQSRGVFFLELAQHKLGLGIADPVDLDSRIGWLL